MVWVVALIYSSFILLIGRHWFLKPSFNSKYYIYKNVVDACCNLTQTNVFPNRTLLTRNIYKGNDIGKLWIDSLSFYKQNNINSKSRRKHKWWDELILTVNYIAWHVHHFLILPVKVFIEINIEVMLFCNGMITVPLEGNKYVSVVWRTHVRLFIIGCISGVSSNPNQNLSLLPLARNVTLFSTG